MILLLSLFFLVSFTFGAITQSVFSIENTNTQTFEVKSNNLITGNTVQETAISSFIEETPKEIVEVREKASPQDWVSESNINVYKDRVVIYVDNPEWARFTDTNSMDPVFDAGSNAIEIVPTSPDQIKEGDIVSFDYKEDSIIHRVIATGYDDKGWFMLTKGDNNQKVDPQKTRFEDVNRVVIAIIY